MENQTSDATEEFPADPDKFPGARARAKVVLFVSDTTSPTHFGIGEFNTMPAIGDSISLPDQPLLKVIWRRFEPAGDKYDAILGCNYFQSKIEEPRTESEAELINRNLKQNKDIIIDIQTRAFDKATAYTNFIVVAGYAAIFTIWSNVKALLTPNDAGLIGLLILFSFSIFVVYELSRMIITSWSMRATSLAAAKSEYKNNYIADLAGAERSAQILTARFLKLWPFFLILTTIPALAAAVILAMRFLSLVYSGKA